jgi:hypothetical protein
MKTTLSSDQLLWYLSEIVATEMENGLDITSVNMEKDVSENYRTIEFTMRKQ